MVRLDGDKIIGDANVTHVCTDKHNGLVRQA